MDAFLKALPKCEHHLHLEGCLTPSLFFFLAAKNKIPLPDTPAYASPAALTQAYGHFTCLDDFLASYYRGMAVLVDTADFEALAWSYFETAVSDGIVHAEVFFDPQSHTSRGVAFDTVVTGYERACRRAERELGISTRLIMCFLRDHSVASAEATMKEAIARGYVDGDQESRIISGVGLDSCEIGYPAELFTKVYAEARQRGLWRTAHGGEEGGPEYIRGGLDALNCQRIDHGIRLVEDPVLLQRVADERILLTVCPLSNVCLRAVSQLEDVPIQKFLQAGVRFSINSDDPAYFGGFLLKNYEAVQEAFGLSCKDWETIVVNSIEGSWISEARKQQLLALVNECMDKYGF
ncbi:hypothetical protein TD95_002703 [Thielaviopsis punctulata]|uniref:Adenine deaminase n=1 Tax=Thielaviopsis punctulata TaxID=72032 RepID=A0A0F4Z7B7_9PEZI|nr:hypothetical protein TD95_002703 [Thielaviopsis punctulata]